MKKVGIAILGLGTVGGGTYDLLTGSRDQIKRTQGVDVTVKRILTRSREKLAARGIDESVLAGGIAEIVSDPEISVVVETIGGVDAAKSYVIEALTHGKSVVTANKEMIAKYWHELEPIARKNGVGLYFEASCVGGVPVIRTLTDSMQANKIQSLYGIINGTTNYILTKMTEEGLSYENALREAQQLGYAELNPSADVDGFDATYKLSILSSLAFHTSIPYEKIYREGITKITPFDIKRASELGYVIKLLAIGRIADGKVEARVHPTFVPKGNPLAAVGGAFNAVLISGDYVGDVMLYGKGAGANPTASAVVSDIVECAKRDTHDTGLGISGKGEFAPDFTSKYYISLTVEDKVGVLAAITGELAEAGVSIDTIRQKVNDGGYASIIFLTHTASENAVKAALCKIEKLSSVISIDSLVRCL